MRWQTKKDDPPKGGELRCRYIIAWKPTEVGDKTVWLERYEIKERFFQPTGGGPGWWSEISRNTLDCYL